MRGRGVRGAGGRRALRRWAGPAVTVILVTAVTACGGSGNSSGQGDWRGLHKDGEQKPETAAFPDKGVIVTASCAKSTDDQAYVTVTGWDAQTWEQKALRTFPVPAAAVNASRFLTTMTRSPLADLCGNAFDDAGVVADGPNRIPKASLRQLFDKGSNRMAVVLMDPDTKATRAGYVDSRGKVTELSADDDEDFADAPHEENAVFSGNGSAVWFTEDDKEKVQLASRSVSGDHARTEHGSVDQNTTDARLVLVDDSTRGLYGVDVRVSPDERKATAFISGAGYHILDLPQRNIALNNDLDGPEILYDIDCYGWIDEVRVLCGADGQTDDPERQNSFWTLDTSGLTGVDEIPDSAMGGPIIPATDRENTAQAISPDGKHMIFASLQGDRLTFYLCSTAPGSTPKKIAAPGAEEALGTGYVLEWR